MKIAFVGKGGSGKSTISSLFTKYLLDQNLAVLGFDADINVNYLQNIKINAKEYLAISKSNNSEKIKSFLIGNNKKIESINHFIKTTPPGQGSKYLEYDKNNFIIQNFGQKLGSGYFFYVGKYESNGIGTSCYHNNLSIFENILSHTKLKENEYLVSDMSAGTDAFSNTLHAQFNKIILIVNPSQESIKVAKDFLQLGKDAKTEKNIYLAINNYEDQYEIDFIEKNLGKKVDIYFEKNKIIKQKSLFGQEISLQDTNYTKSFDKLLKINNGYDDKCIIENLKLLHKKYSQLGYIIRRIGDVSLQAKD
ncbi:nucleotide-binding protein [Candidatus Vampirococcus lugosii]|uniref:CO dehydrogenase accessory protein CooC (Nickel insertion) n=1 Tax=Candidatus Vampirococcus lugosii TaxID=2789015 RepID=A0ABS5QP60_9BACT|nr:hypothetical protein [Candidatus Vampirococcus lugosii]MBS8122457.1 CO dehydrogenase accessory protein CooC (nickel insertion) [Candidatus Vampirococcus lugosii]